MEWSAACSATLGHSVEELSSGAEWPLRPRGWSGTVMRPAPHLYRRKTNAWNELEFPREMSELSSSPCRITALMLFFECCFIPSSPTLVGMTPRLLPPWLCCYALESRLVFVNDWLREHVGAAQILPPWEQEREKLRRAGERLNGTGHAASEAERPTCKGVDESTHRVS